ncbi:MAG TPA: PDZ domain-containing protein, partial [Bacteroidota bacterium]|nr:PDZ domain-containing protein [Bacteroidota bacterium]
MTGRIFAAALILLCAAGGTAASQERTERGHGRTWLGVTIQDVTPRLARDRDLHVKSGALVGSVSDESPASRGGIRENDVIVEFNGKPVEDAGDLVGAVRDARPGAKATVGLYRGSEKRSLDVTLEEGPEEFHGFAFRGPVHIPRIPRVRIFRAGDMMGLTLSDLNRQLGEYFQAPDGHGVLVEEVERESAGAKAGFKAGDVIIRAGSERVERTEDFADAFRDLRKGDSLGVSILRRGSPLSLTLRAEDETSWEHPRSMREEMRMLPHFDRNSFRRDMEKLK